MELAKDIAKGGLDIAAKIYKPALIIAGTGIGAAIGFGAVDAMTSGQFSRVLSEPLVQTTIDQLSYYTWPLVIAAIPTFAGFGVGLLGGELTEAALETVGEKIKPQPKQT